MAYYADLAPCDYFGKPTNPLIAVGWLEAGKPYPQDKLRDEVFQKIMQILSKAWQPMVFMGSHQCDLCPATVGVRFCSLQRYGLSVSFGVGNLFVPGDHRVFVAPSMIVHYIDAHQYHPPEEFCRAVLNCPEMGSLPYFEALAYCAVVPPAQEFRP